MSLHCTAFDVTTKSAGTQDLPLVSYQERETVIGWCLHLMKGHLRGCAASALDHRAPGGGLLQLPRSHMLLLRCFCHINVRIDSDAVHEATCPNGTACRW